MRIAPGTPTARPPTPTVPKPSGRPLSHEHVGRRSGRRRLATFVRGDRRGRALAGRRVEQHERAAAHSRRLRLDERQHELHGDRRIHGAAALAQDSQAGVRRVTVGRDDELLFRAERRGRLRGREVRRRNGERSECRGERGRRASSASGLICVFGNFALSASATNGCTNALTSPPNSAISRTRLEEMKV